MKAKIRKRAPLHCTATSSTQHIKKLWSLDKKNVEVIKQNISNLSNPRWPTCIHGYHGNGT